MKVSVAIPMLKGRSEVIVDRGRPWSVVEHLLLASLSSASSSSKELAVRARIPKRVAIESLIRLMRAGWVELKQDASQVLFSATASGMRASSQVELPRIHQKSARTVGYLVEMATGAVFKNKDWWVVHESELKRRQKGGEPIAWLEANTLPFVLSGKSVVEAVLDPDESYVDSTGSGLSTRYAVVSVSEDGQVEGLPEAHVSRELNEAVLAAAKLYRESGGAKKRIRLAPIQQVIERRAPIIHKIHFLPSDVVIGGNAHRGELERIITSARTRVLIHSTFIDESKFLSFLPAMKAAVDRGVTFQVYWGQNEDRDEARSSQIAVANLQKNRDVLELSRYLSIHPFSTGSHAKFIVGDSGDDGEFEAVVGSCNWLASAFAKLEVSARLRDSEIVGEVLSHLARLVSIRGGVWTDDARALTRLAQEIKRRRRSTEPNAIASVVIGAQHGSYVLKARDEAKEKILVLSHKLGPVGFPAVLVPLTEARRSRPLQVQLFYEHKMKPVTGADEASARSSAHADKVDLVPISTPRIHAKLLAWDGDSLLVTSLNWLSADPGDPDVPKEMGIWIQGTSICSELHRLPASFKK